MYGNNKFTLASMYGPKEDNPEFFRATLEHIENLGNDKKIIGGDFNLVLDPEVDRSVSIETHTNTMELLRTYMEENAIIDIWRIQNPNEKKFTWHKFSSLAFSRIDMFLITSSLHQFIENTGIIPGFKTDHSLPYICLAPSNIDKGLGY